VTKINARQFGHEAAPSYVVVIGPSISCYRFFVFDVRAVLRATACRTSALKATSSTSSPS
jgi:hypothetical protein